MKLTVRLFVAALALTGAAASAHVTTTATAKKAPMQLSSVPVPSCPPDDPTACGM